MAWYYGTYACGHEGRVNIVGPSKDREWKKERTFEGLCPECYEKKRQEKIQLENKKAEEEAREMGFPQLEGSEKQVAWANTIRNAGYAKLQETLQERIKEARREEVGEAIDYFMLHQTSASWWIENRDKFSYFTKEFFKSIIHKKVEDAQKAEDEKKKEEINEEIVVYPQEVQYPGKVEIKIADKLVSAIYEKNADFIKIVKELGYSWSGSAWEKKIKPRMISAEDRAAELGNVLLNAGFGVCISDPQVRQNAIDGIFEREYDRWLTEDEGKLAFLWLERNDKLYKSVKRIPTASWCSPYVHVNVEHYQEALDFADINDFGVSKTAKALIEQYKAKVDASLKVQPVEHQEEEKEDKLQEILNSSTAVLDDLKDED